MQKDFSKPAYHLDKPVILGICKQIFLKLGPSVERTENAINTAPLVRRLLNFCWNVSAP